MTIHNPYLLGLGITAIIMGVLLWRWAGRNRIDVRGAAVRSGLTAVRGRALPTLPDQFKHHLAAVSAQPTTLGRAKVVGVSVVRHWIAGVATVASLAGLLGGTALVAVSVLWK